ncbi:MAG: hypothetical protein V7637_2532 [Mycobacteriales bacterium]|jgi:hypothetical protein
MGDMTAVARFGGAPARDWRSAARRLAGSAATTPGRLQLVRAGLLILAVLTGLLGALAAGAAGSGTRQVARATEPLLVNAETIYTSLADADATAAQAFLAGGLPPAQQTARYRSDLNRAGTQLALAAARAGDSGAAADAVRTLATQLPVYAGLVEAARANNRQGFPVGAAYLSEASQLCRAQLLPAAQRLFTLEQANLAGGYRSAGARWRLLLAILAVLALLGALIAVQRSLYRRTHRVFSPPLVAAAVLTVVLAGVLGGVFAVQHSRLSRAQSQGSDPVGILARARIAALQERADEALTLVGRGNGAAYETDFTAVHSTLVGSPGTTGLLPAAAAQATGAEQRQRVADAQAAATGYAAVHRQIRALDDGGDYNAAVRRATSSDPNDAAAAFGRLDGALTAAIDADQARFSALAEQAGGGLGLLTGLVPIVAAAVGVLAALGLRARLQEYR